MNIFTHSGEKDDRVGKENPLCVPHVAPPLLRVDPVVVLRGHTDRVWCVAWCPVSRVLASCAGDGTVRLWGCSARGSWECVSTLQGEHGRTVRHVAWSPSGEYIACASFDRTASVWRRSSDDPMCFDFELESVLDGHESEVKCVAWATDNTLATCSRDRTVWIWDRIDVGEYECGGVLAGHAQDVKSCTWILPSSGSGEKALLLSSSYDNTVKVWMESHRRDDWYCAQTLTRHAGTVWMAAIQPVMVSTAALCGDREGADGGGKECQPVVCCCSDDKSLTFWARGADGKFRVVATASGFAERSVYAVAWAPGDDAILACGSGDNKITLLGLHKSVAESEVHVTVLAEEPAAHEADVNSVAFSPLPRAAETEPFLLASGGDDNTVRLWNVTKL